MAHETPKLLPTLEGFAPGVVAIEAPGEKPRTTLQCQDCGALETPERLIHMTFKFVGCWPSTEPKRRCPECRAKHLELCDYPGHVWDRERR